MSKSYTCLSFFKTNKISYYYEKPLILFPCPFCQKEATMNTFDGKWMCGCGESGTLITLQTNIDLYNTGKSIVLNPKKTRKKINSQFDFVIASLAEQKRIKSHVEQLKALTNELVEYLTNKKA
ncbi:hypothetical protein [Falsibacillus pallidus]|uniref:Uncharacterized protein n=1 Tax=Falsibacillus pallidus TaxID=493781 RepID=A0A370GK72_9BACI|nr:hypothetical protein [Falsibacillus pallidus]RDI44061.1 hypothetical protein DFR59_103124 [Falsibacillus pallidus]